MIKEGSSFRVSASDLVDTIACAHKSRLNRAAACSEPVLKNPESQFNNLFANHGIAHEKRILETYKSLSEILEFDLDQVRNSTGGYAEATRQTLDAMKRGVPVIYQAVLLHDGFLGLVDFLVVRHDSFGNLLRDDSGRYIYEPVDAKLARRERVSALVQLGGYAAVLEDMGCATPIEVHIKLGNGNTFSARAETLMPVARQMRSRLQNILNEPEILPNPIWGEACPACEKCDWSDHCSLGREVAKDLALVYGMRADTRKKLRAVGISTYEDLADKTVPSGSGIKSETVSRLQAQAKLQIKAEKLGGGIIAEFIGSKGLDLLPPSDLGDIWFDMESDILFDLGIGLEYMFGVLSNDKSGFFTIEAHDRVGEKKAFENFVDYVKKRLEKFPAMHVYHFANYEVAAMKRLAQRHGTREVDIDQFLRDHVFVDLYQVVRHSIRTSARSLGLKDIENLYMNRGATAAGQVANAVDSMVEYERYVVLMEDGKQTEAASVLENIRRYNQFDCESTRGLDGWLRNFAQQSVSGSSNG